MTAALAHLAATLLLVLTGGWDQPAGPGPRTGEGVWPLRPRPQVTAGFSPPEAPWLAGHRGVDLAGRAGQRVHAAAGGTVTYAGELAGRGVVVVDHGDTRSTYQPVRATVAVGEAVQAGDVLGRLQVFGSHCWPRACLHWGLLRGSTYLDPLQLVGAAPVRLLPLYADPAASTYGPADTEAAAAPPGTAAPAARVGRTAGVRFVRPWGGPVGTPAGGGRW